MHSVNVSRVIGIALAAAALSGCGYQKFVDEEQAIKTEWVDVQADLQRRNEMIPGLVDAVKAQTSREEPVFQELIDSRAKLTAAKTPQEAINAANQQSSALLRLSALIDQDPPLKANPSLIRLRDDLQNTEIRLSVERMRYNARVQIYDTNRRAFPGGLMAGLLNFPNYPFYEVPMSDPAK